ncbi:hypothetical protein [Desulfolucanica intricata]|uniref:hypothetical protein n=1 Tax=Desulfolucanica intricata TaxID=1285191 RepID=UPI0008353B50|nr:hypothetical protein [Desulfolucanica intricata]
MAEAKGRQGGGIINRANEEYLWQKLEWAKERISALEKIEAKLYEKKILAVYAKDNHLSNVEKQEINTKINKLREEVTDMDDKSRTFWMDCH